MDVDTIEAGLDFVEVLENAVQSCDVLVALIGKQWLSIKDSAGNQRLDNPQDFVRVEITAALQRGIRLIPVLFDNVPMPNSDQLPRGLKSLARRNAVFVTHHSFHTDVNRLIDQLELALNSAEESKILKTKEFAEKEARRERQAETANLLSQADIAITLNDWELAKEKLESLLALEPEHAQAQVKFAIAQRKLNERKDTVEQVAAEKNSREKTESEIAEKPRLENTPDGKTETTDFETAWQGTVENSHQEKTFRQKINPEITLESSLGAEEEHGQNLSKDIKTYRSNRSPEKQKLSSSWIIISIISSLLFIGGCVWFFSSLLTPDLYFLPTATFSPFPTQTHTRTPVITATRLLPSITVTPTLTYTSTPSITPSPTLTHTLTPSFTPSPAPTRLTPPYYAYTNNDECIYVISSQNPAGECIQRIPSGTKIEVISGWGTSYYIGVFIGNKRIEGHIYSASITPIE